MHCDNFVVTQLHMVHLPCCSCYSCQHGYDEVTGPHTLKISLCICNSETMMPHYRSQLTLYVCEPNDTVCHFVFHSGATTASSCFSVLLKLQFRHRFVKSTLNVQFPRLRQWVVGEWYGPGCPSLLCLCTTTSRFFLVFFLGVCRAHLDVT